MSIVLDGLKHKVNKNIENAMTCLAIIKTKQKCRKHKQWFSQSVDWKLLLHVESRAGVEQQRRRVRTRIVLCPQLVKMSLDVTCDFHRWWRRCTML